MRPLITAAFALSLLGGISALADPQDNHRHGGGSSSGDQSSQPNPPPRAHGDWDHADRNNHPAPVKPASPAATVQVPVAPAARPVPPRPPMTQAQHPTPPASPQGPQGWRGGWRGPNGGTPRPDLHGGDNDAARAEAWRNAHRGDNGPGQNHDWRDHGQGGGDNRDHGDRAHDGDHHDRNGHDQNWRDHDQGRDWRDHGGRDHDWRNNNWRERDHDWRPPQGWNGRHGWLDQHRYPPVRWAQHRYHWRPYYQPYGWYARTWNYGDFLPWAWFGEQNYIDDYYEFGLQEPPYGYIWVRVGDDALLVDRYTGQVVAVEHDLFY